MRRENKISISVCLSLLCWYGFYFKSRSSNGLLLLLITSSICLRSKQHIYGSSPSTLHGTVKTPMQVGEKQILFFSSTRIFLFKSLIYRIREIGKLGEMDTFLKSTQFSEVLCSVSHCCQKETRKSNEIIVQKDHIVVRGMNE